MMNRKAFPSSKRSKAAFSLVPILVLALILSGCSAFPALTAAVQAGSVPVADSAPLNADVVFPPTYTATPFLTATLAPSATTIPANTTMPSLTPMPTITLTPTITRTPRPTVISTEQQMRGDLHMHTTCSDGEDELTRMVAVAQWWGYGFIAVTDHHWCEDVIQFCINETRLLCFPGLEVPTLERLEVLAIGITHPVREGLTVPETVQRIHAEGGIAIAAHPWTPGFEYNKSLLLHSGLDAMECPPDGSQPMPFDTSALPCVYDSDAHSSLALDPYTSNLCDMPIRSLEDLRFAITHRLCHHYVPPDL